MANLQNIGEALIFGPDENIEGRIIRASGSKFQKGQLVRIVVHRKHLLSSGQRDIFNQLATIEDMNEWRGSLIYGLKSIFADVRLGNFSENEIVEAGKI